MKLRLALLVALSTLITLLVSLYAYQSVPLATQIYGYWTYYLILALFLLWCATIFGSMEKSTVRTLYLLKKYSLPWMGALLMTAMVFNSVPSRFRVLSDETNLISVSQSLFYSKSAFNPTMNKKYFGVMNPINAELEKRPAMFPFFISLVHLVRGYKAENAFIVNALALFSLLALIGISAQALIGREAAIPAILLTGAYPLVTSVATSAGFDLLATLFAALSFVFLYRHFREPNALNFSVLWVNLLVFTHIRYESSVIVGVLLISVLCFRAFSWNYLWQRPWVFILTPPLLLPLIVQRILIPHPYENPPGVPAFSSEHFFKFIDHLTSAQSDFSYLLPHANALNWAAIPISLYLLYQYTQGNRPKLPRYFKKILISVLLAIGISLGIFLFYYFGDYTHPASVRFFLNISILAALMPVILYGSKPKYFNKGALLLTSVAAFIVYHPVSVQGRFTQIQTLIRETEDIYRFLENYPVKDILIIYSRPGQLSALEYGAVDFGYANLNKESIHAELSRHLYREILVFQRMSYETLQPLKDDFLDSAYSLETLFELQTTATEYIRASRIKPKPLAINSAK